MESLLIPAPVSAPVRVLAVDDDLRVRTSIRVYFAQKPAFRLVGEATCGSEAIALFARVRPDVVLMDLRLPDLSGVEATRRICSTWPGACVLAFTTFGTREHVVAALRAGAVGYLLKDLSGEHLAAGILQALRGEMPLSSPVRRELVAAVGGDDPSGRSPTEQLTAREHEVLDGLVRGLTNRQISQAMFVSEGSVKAYLAALGTKVGASSRTQILVRAIQLRLVDPVWVADHPTSQMASPRVDVWRARVMSI